MNNLVFDIDSIELLFQQSLRSVLKDMNRTEWEERFSPFERKRLSSIQSKMKEGKSLAEDELRLASYAGLIPRSQCYVWSVEFQKSVKSAEHHFKRGNIKRANSVEELSAMLHLEE
ncbi:MAG: hypothetical protein KGZ58_09180 [Ignavibacteriales bacterium]|nr:hypothetical protein [Ignavibacteriales bacterium]